MNMKLFWIFLLVLLKSSSYWVALFWFFSIWLYDSKWPNDYSKNRMIISKMWGTYQTMICVFWVKYSLISMTILSSDRPLGNKVNETQLQEWTWSLVNGSYCPWQAPFWIIPAQNEPPQSLKITGYGLWSDILLLCFKIISQKKKGWEGVSLCSGHVYPCISFDQRKQNTCSHRAESVWNVLT